MGNGLWFLPLVGSHGRDRRLARLRSIACRAPYSGDGRVRCVSLLRKDLGATRSGSGPWIRKRAHRRWSRLRPGPGNFFRRNAHGALRLASLLHRPGRRQHGLAHSLVCMDAARESGNCFARRERRSRVSRTRQAAFHVGDVRRLVWRELRSLFRNYLAALLPGARAALSSGHDG